MTAADVPETIELLDSRNKHICTVDLTPEIRAYLARMATLWHQSLEVTFMRVLRAGLKLL